MPNPGNLRDTLKGILCDRSTYLGNPFELKREKDRDKVCDAFDQYFNLVVHKDIEPRLAADQIRLAQSLTIALSWKRPNRHQFLRRLASITNSEESTTYLCCCHPKRCHVQTYINYWHQKIRV